MVLIILDPWCNGSTPVFGAVCRGSNPCGSIFCNYIFYFFNCLIINVNSNQFKLISFFYSLKFEFYSKFLINKRMIELYKTGVALVTPFNKDLSIDFASLDCLIDFNLSEGVNYFVILGTTAETATLNEEEKKLIIKFVTKKLSNKVPLILSLGGNNTLEVINTIKTINDISSFSALLSVCPYYNKPNQEGIYQHYKYISKSSYLPIIIYNVPGRTVVNVTIKTILRLVKEFSNIIAIKEASPNFIQSLQILKEKPSHFIVLSGDDDLANSQILAGASGVISVIAQAFPKMFTKMINFAIDKNPKESYKIYYELLNLMFLIFEEGSPAGIKAVLNHLGLIKPYIRLPLVQVSKNLNTKIITETDRIKNLNL